MRFTISILCAGLFLCGCPANEEPTPKKRTSRYAAVAKKVTKSKGSAFCEVSYNPASKAPMYKPPLSKAMPSAAAAYIESEAKNSNSWRWINVWASWCAPCIEEFPLLQRWKNALAKEKIDVKFEFWNMDESEERLVGSLEKLKKLPGSVHWFNSPDDVPTFFKPLGIEPLSPIPVHVLVDGNGRTRCVRVGKVGEDLYGTIRNIVSGE